MHVGEIPDSDPDPPVLDKDNPFWVNLERSWAPDPPPLAARISTPPRSKRRKTSKPIDPTNASSDSQNQHEELHEEDENGETHDGQRHRPRTQRNSPVPEEIRDESVEHSTSASIASENVPRRRRFNFAKWVQEDRRTHEYVYRRRFRDFHGALSDSEDEDYAELQNMASQPSMDQQESMFQDQSDDDEEEDDAGEEEEEGHLGVEESNGGTNEVETDHDNMVPTSAINRRSWRIIDSDSSDDDDDDDGSDVIPMFEKKLTKSIPATSRATDTDITPLPESYSESQSDGFTQSQPSESQTALSHFVASASMEGGEAQEDYGGIDYMMTSHRSTKKRSAAKSRTNDALQVDLAQLTRKAGTMASKALKVAARTVARKRPLKSTSNGHRKIPRGKINGPHGKLFVNQSPEAMQTLRRWERNEFADAYTPTLSDISVAGVSPTPKYSEPSPRSHVRQQNRQQMNPVVGPSRKGTDRPQNIPPLSPLYTAATKRKSKKRSKVLHSVEPNPNLFRTTIIERALGNQPSALIQKDMENVAPRSRKAQARANYPPRSIQEREARKESGDRRGNDRKIHVKLHSPKHALNLEEFDRSTFIGSNVLELLGGPTISNTVDTGRQSTLFKTPVRCSNEVKIATDTATILELCSVGIEPETFDELYSYFLQGCVFLIDESEIVEPEFRKFVLHEWLRLARTLLKASIRNGWLSSRNTTKSRWLLMTAQLVSLAVVILHNRVAMLSPNAISSSKVKLLVGWMSYYHQFEISRQVDYLGPSGRHRIGAELVYVCQKLNLFEVLPRIFEKSQDSRANWHMMILLTSTGSNWCDWGLARQLVASDIHTQQRMRTSMLYIQRLLSHWHWPASAEIVIDLFIYYAKQQHYADPRGESIWLSSSLWASNFDGRRQPEEDFSMFLELLGLTLRKLSNDSMSTLRVAGRVTPLSALSFPKSKEVSLSDLSSASHQYGILIVLLRILEGAGRPSVGQFRDLVVLKDAHWAIKVKAVSAWSIVARLSTSSSELKECRLWMAEDILQGDFLPEALKVAALRSSADLIPVSKAAIPGRELVETGLKSGSSEVREKAWELYTKLKLTKDLEDIPFFPHFELSDLDWVSRLLTPFGISSVPKWCSKNNVPRSVEVLMYSLLLETGKIRASDLRHPVAGLVVGILMELVPTQEESRLVAAAGAGDKSLKSERRPAVLRFLAVHRDDLSEADYFAALARSKANLETMDPAAAATYLPAVTELRRVAFAKFPHLSTEFAMPQNNEVHILETMQQNILSFANRRDFTCYYYFAYRLQNCCDFKADGGDTTPEASRFITELMTALSTGEQEADRKISNLVFNCMFASFFDMAKNTYSKTLKSKVSYMLPILIKAAVANLGRGTKLEFHCTRLIFSVMRYLKDRLRTDDKVVFHPPTSLLIQLFCVLATLWLHQNAARGAVLPELAEKILILLRLISRHANSNDHSSTREFSELDLDEEQLICFSRDIMVYSMHDSTDPIAAFHTSEVDDLTVVNDQHRAILIRSIQTLTRHIVAYSAVRSTT